MRAHRQIVQFHGDPKPWTSYLEQSECYFVANDVVDARKQHAILLSCCGASTYSLILSLAALSRTTDVTRSWWRKSRHIYFAPRCSRIVSSFKFNLGSQQLGESITMYVSELRKLSEFCEYGETLEDMLCDRLVCGLAERQVQQCLLVEGDLTLEKALKIGQAMELAERDARDLHQASAHSRAESIGWPSHR